MKKIIFPILFCLIAVPVFAQSAKDDGNAKDLIEKTVSAYKALNSYKSHGKITGDIESDGRKTPSSTEFSMVLRKPNLYLISWTNKMAVNGTAMTSAGVVWNDGKQAYLYTRVGSSDSSSGSYDKMNTDQRALASATGISSGAALTIPDLFFSFFDNTPMLIRNLANPKITGSEKIGEDDCFIVSGSSPVFKEERYWISKKSNLIIKYARSFEHPKGGPIPEIPKPSDQKIEQLIKDGGGQVTAESKQQMREMLNSADEKIKASESKGSITEYHMEISSPDLSESDFHFEIPKGAVLKQ